MAQRGHRSTTPLSEQRQGPDPDSCRQPAPHPSSDNQKPQAHPPCPPSLHAGSVLHSCCRVFLVRPTHPPLPPLYVASQSLKKKGGKTRQPLCMAARLQAHPAPPAPTQTSPTSSAGKGIVAGFHMAQFPCVINAGGALRCGWGPSSCDDHRRRQRARVGEGWQVHPTWLQAPAHPYGCSDHTPTATAAAPSVLQGQRRHAHSYRNTNGGPHTAAETPRGPHTAALAPTGLARGCINTKVAPHGCSDTNGARTRLH